MSLAQAPLPDRGASPLMSNNPFRNRIASASPRPVSTNPFLDNAEILQTNTAKSVSPDTTQAATDFFASLDINRNTSPQKQGRPLPNGLPRRPDNAPPRPTRGPPPPSGHRPTLSDEERRRRMGPVRRTTELDIFADPPPSKSRPRQERRPRRNSESSVMDKGSVLDADEEKRRQERRLREAKRTGTTKGKPSRKLDIIDKLDLTSIYGTGLFHHDGPFDACNPHRNRRKHKLAPMQAFPKDSENMKIGGSGPVNAKLDYNTFHGYGQEAHIDFNEARQGQAVVDDDAAYVSRPNVPRHASFNATARVEQVHGDESAGLGTSTFLEGAPASRAAMQRRDSEFEHQQDQGPGLSRKKSLAQKIRGVRPTPRLTSPNAERQPTSPLATGQSDSAANPFFKDYDQDYERKGQQIAFAEQEIKPGRARAPSSPKNGLELEKQITPGGSEVPAESKPMGLLGRMKSLKKPRSRSERREAS